MLKMMRFSFCVYIVVLVLFGSSCRNSDKDGFVSLVKEWEGREILFPVDLVFTVQEDTEWRLCCLGRARGRKSGICFQ